MSRPSVIYLGADHAGFALKESVKRHVQSAGFEVEDLGAHEVDPTDDYPVYAARVASVVRENPRSVGLLFCGSAEGICIAANKFDGIRSGIGFSAEAAKSLRLDDHGNVLCLPGRIGTSDDPMMIVDAFLNAEPSMAARHERRVEEIQAIEAQE
jgi:ribose 5-phosphate isomerase B